MVDTSKLIDDIKQQEQKGLFRGLRKRKQMADKYRPTQKSIIQNLPFHIQNALKLTGEFKLLDRFEKIVIAGIGINAQAGEILREYLSEYRFDMRVVRDFSLPEDVDAKTLAVIASYTGNDEEAISCYKNALRKGCRIVGLSSGGRLVEGFTRNNTEHIILPKNLVESTTLCYILFPLIAILENSSLIKPQKEIMDETIKSLKSQELRDMAKVLYEKLRDRVPVIYSSPELSVITNYWKMQFNLNAKIPCFSGVFSDAAYSDLNAYIKDIWDFYLVFIRDQGDSDLINKSMATAKKIIRNKGHGTTEILIKGTNKLSRLMTCAFIADITSYYLSEYYKIEEDLVQKYREEFKTY